MPTHHPAIPADDDAGRGGSPGHGHGVGDLEAERGAHGSGSGRDVRRRERHPGVGPGVAEVRHVAENELLLLLLLIMMRILHGSPGHGQIDGGHGPAIGILDGLAGPLLVPEVVHHVPGGLERDKNRMDNAHYISVLLQPKIRHVLKNNRHRISAGICSEYPQ